MEKIKPKFRILLSKMPFLMSILNQIYFKLQLVPRLDKVQMIRATFYETISAWFQ